LIPLANNYGTVLINLTPDFDTLHSWESYSDYKCSGVKIYRIQSSKYPMTEENGNFNSSFPDSLYGVTISHVYPPECSTNVRKTTPVEYLADLKQHFLAKNPITKLNVIENININGLTFSVIATTSMSEKKMFQQELFASTFYKYSYLSFSFVKSSRVLSDTFFIRDSYEMLKTLKIR
jgi:hypothetical protein